MMKGENMIYFEKVTSEKGIVSIEITNIGLYYMKISIERGDNSYLFLGNYHYRWEDNGTTQEMEKSFVLELKDLLGYLSLVNYFSNDHRSIMRRVPKEHFSNLSVFDDYLQFTPAYDNDRLMIEDLTKILDAEKSYRLNLVDDNGYCRPYFVLALLLNFPRKSDKRNLIAVSEKSLMEFSYCALELLPSFWYLMHYCKKYPSFRISNMNAICQLSTTFEYRTNKKSNEKDIDASEYLHLFDTISLIDKFTSEWGWDELCMAYPKE